MKSIEKLNGEELLASSIPFFATPDEDALQFADELQCEYEDEQLVEINQLVRDYACMSIIRFMEFLSKAETDKQLVARFICLKKLFDNRHGNWIKLCEGHNVTVKTVRTERDKI